MIHKVSHHLNLERCGNRIYWISGECQLLINGCAITFFSHRSELFACLKALYMQTSWEEISLAYKSTPWTLTHGDFHIGNTMWKKNDEGEGVAKDERRRGKIRLFDWENVGWSSGPQELGTYVISSFNTKECGKDEQLKLVRAYYNQLIQCNPQVEKSMDFSRCWHEFLYGGFQWHLWILPMMEQFPEMFVYFAGIYEKFLRDHGIVADKIGPPSV